MNSSRTVELYIINKIIYIIIMHRFGYQVEVHRTQSVSVFQSVRISYFETHPCKTTPLQQTGEMRAKMKPPDHAAWRGVLILMTLSLWFVMA